MAKEDEEELRRRRRAREDEKEEEEFNAKKEKQQTSSVPDSAHFEDLMSRLEPMIDQVDSLYIQYVKGVERRPPLERRKTLDQLMATVSMMGKPTQGAQFRYNTLHASYNTHRDKWDKMLRDLEAGKIKRITGPQRGN